MKKEETWVNIYYANDRVIGMGKTHHSEAECKAAADTGTDGIEVRATKLNG